MSLPASAAAESSLPLPASDDAENDACVLAVWRDAGLKRRFEAGMLADGLFFGKPDKYSMFHAVLAQLCEESGSRILPQLRDCYHLQCFPDGQADQLKRDGEKWRVRQNVKVIMYCLTDAYAVQHRETVAEHLARHRVDILDFGCGHGTVIVALGAALKVPAHRVFGCDIQTCSKVAGVRALPPAQFFQIDTAVPPRLPYHDGQMGLVMSMLVLHHILDPHLTRWLREIVRVLRPGGLFLLKEQNLHDPKLRHLFDLQHLIFAQVSSKAVSTLQGVGACRYGSRDWWKAQCASVGLRAITQDYPAKGPNHLEMYHEVFQKL